MRLDIYLFEVLQVQSRNKASELIKKNEVLVNGKIINKASYNVEENDEVQILSKEQFVSRSAYKLKHFLSDQQINVNGLSALDIGASTGGFTQVLLRENIKEVTCVDVGSNQLHPCIKDDSKITFFENTDIRDFASTQKYDLVTCDISFISVRKILNDIDRLAGDKIIILFKPQFEVGANVKRDKKGVVVDINAIARAKAEFFEECSRLGWKLIVQTTSEVAGKEGNIEEFYYFGK